MGKSSSAQKFEQLARFIAPKQTHKPFRVTQLKPVSKARPIDHPNGRKPESLKLNCQKMEAVEPLEKGPLADVVANCVKRWFQDTLKEAKSGNTAMQVLVGQMYSSGYGTVKDTQMVKFQSLLCVSLIVMVLLFKC